MDEVIYMKYWLFPGCSWDKRGKQVQHAFLENHTSKENHDLDHAKISEANSRFPKLTQDIQS